MVAKGFLTGFFLFLLAGTFGCAAPGGETGEDRYYLNANLGFAIEHPASWLRVKDADPTEVKWTGPVDKKRRQASTLVLSAYPPAGKTADGIETIFLAAHPGLFVTTREDIQLPASAGRRILGHDPGRKYLAYLLAADRGAYILEFSAPPDEFGAGRALFETMAESFRILAPPTAPAPLASEN